MRIWLAALAAWACAGAASAQELSFVPGRPGNTESPDVAPAGHWQLETEIASYSDRDGGDSWSALTTSFRYGLARSWDAEAIVSPLNRADGETGLGDVTLRLRKQFSGLDGESPSFALIGYVTLPTAEDGLGADHLEGGIIATSGVSISDRASLTLTAGLGSVSEGDDDELGISGGAAYGYSFTGATGAYVEIFGEHVDGETAATLDIGMTHLLDERTQIDAGVDFGLNDNADDARFFVGWAHLF
ncbi:MAG TPA: transporter [Caulobacterales bacterium]|nr:transporter [Caulobacterales bacterium]